MMIYIYIYELPQSLQGAWVFLCFLLLRSSTCCVDDVQGWGGVGCQHSCTSFIDDVTLMMFRGGVGWGGMLTFIYRYRYMLTIHRSWQP